MDEVVERVIDVRHKGETRMVMKKKQKREWSNLPSDIVGHIIGKLYWSDRIRMRSVCGSWLQVSQHGIPPIDHVPWIMGFRWLRKLVGRVYSCCEISKEEKKSKKQREGWRRYTDYRESWSIERETEI